MARKKPIISPLGQWAYPGEVTIIPSSNITMKGVNYPVLGIDDLGNQQMMMPGQDYTFPGNYVTEIPQMGKGGLRQWFDEKWVDVKTGKACGRSGKDKDGRPYPACRPSKRVNETTPKTTSEMSSAEKARFKREKTSGKRIDYNHKRKELGGEAGWLEQYQVGGPIDPEFMFKNKYNTELTSSEEADFSKWAAKESQKQGRDILNDMGAYDVKGFWKSGDYKNMDSDNHGTDTWKKPNHPTFSNQSKYHGADGWYGGNWTDKTGYQPSKQTLETYGPDYYNWMFKSEPGRSEYLDMSRYESGLNKPTPFVYQKGGWLKSYQDGGTEQNPERMQGVDIKRKRKNVSDSPKYQYDSKGNLLYTPEINIQPYISDNSSRDEFLVNPKLSIQNLNPTVEEFRTVAAPYYPIDNKLVADPKINLQPSNYQQSLEQEYVLPQVVGKSFGNLPLVKDDGYSPNRRWVSNLRAKDTAAKFGKDSYAYVLKTNPNNLVDYPTRNKIENNLSLNNKTFYDYLAKNNYSPDTVEHLTRKLPDQIWNRAEQMRVEMRNNPEIMSWANLHNVDLGYKEKGESDDDFAPKIPESIYAARLAKAGLPTNRPDYEYAPMETYIVQDPSKFDLAGYFPMGSIVKDAEQKVLNKKIPGKLKREYISSNSPEYFEKEAYIKDEMARRMGVNPSAFDSGEYLIHYNKTPITEYTPGKKYGGWLEEYQAGGRPIYTSNPRDPRLQRFNDSLSLYEQSKYLRNLSQNSASNTNVLVDGDKVFIPYKNWKPFVYDPIDLRKRNALTRAEILSYQADELHDYNNLVNSINKRHSTIKPESILTLISSSRFPNGQRLTESLGAIYKRPVAPIYYKKPTVLPKVYKKPEVVPEVVETPVAPVPVVEPPKPSLFVSNIDRDMYTPGGGMAREYNIGVTLQDGNRKSFRTEKEFQDWKAANNLDISKAKVTEGRGYSYDYPENKKYGGWLSKYQPGGGWAGWTPNVGKPYMRTSPAGNAGYSDNTRVVNQNTNVSAANRKAAEAAEYAKRVGSVSQGKVKSNYEKAKEATSFVAQGEKRNGSASPLDYVLDMVNPATYGFAGIDLVGNTAMGMNNYAKGNFSEAAGNAFDAGMNALYLAPAFAELRGPLYAGIPKAFVNKSKAELERQAGVDWLKNWYGQPEIKQRFNQQIYNPAIADDLVMPIYKKNVLTDVIEKPKSTINLDKSAASDFASTMSKEKYAELKYGFKNDPIVSLKYGEDIPATHKKYLGVNSGFGNNMGGYTNVYPEHPEFFYNRFNPNSQWKPTVKGTSIHEGTHWLTTGDEGLAESTKAMFKEPFDLSKRISKQDKYLTKPTEIHARLNELRSQYNLGPTVTQSQVDKIIADGLKGNTTVQKRFFELLKDNKSLTNLFNTAMGISAPLAAASQLPEQKNGGWLNKYK